MLISRCSFNFSILFIIFPSLWLAKYTWTWHLSIRIILCAITSPVSDYMPDSCSMNMLVRKGAHTLVSTPAFIHTHVDGRRRLKRSRTSIALAINAPSRLFVYPSRTRDSALSTPTCTPSSRSPLLSSTPYFADSSGCNFFFGRWWVCFLRAAVSDNSTGSSFSNLSNGDSRFRLAALLFDLHRTVQKYFEITWQCCRKLY